MASLRSGIRAGSEYPGSDGVDFDGVTGPVTSAPHRPVLEWFRRHFVSPGPSATGSNEMNRARQVMADLIRNGLQGAVARNPGLAG
jgi:hypothetical protein